MAYYMAYGKNGVVVTKDSHKLPKMGWYMKDIQHAEYGTFEAAERAALTHLNKIVPEGVPKPDMIVLDQMIFKSSLVKTYIAKKTKKGAEQNDD